MHKLTFTAAVVLTSLCDLAAAQMVPVEWNSAGQFDKELTIAPGKFVEACEKLPGGAKVGWSFEASALLDFNIHYHEGKQVRFPAEKSNVTQDAGTLAAQLDQDYCWMWTNKGAAEATLRVKLAKR